MSNGRSRSLAIIAVFGVACAIHLSSRTGAEESAAADGEGYAELRVIDAATGRGVPLVELETVSHVKYVTDNAGRIAFHEKALMNTEVFFTVRSHGYEMKKDSFGYSGVKLNPQAGKVSEITIARRNIAERLCRLTGQGLYRDTLLLGYKSPLADSANPGRVAGQDSVQAAPYKGELYWFWGDTSRMNYPLGLFRTAGAKTPLPRADNDPAAGIAFDYFVDKTGFTRAMIPYRERAEGVIWIDGVCTVPDENGVEKLVAHYSRRKGLAEELEHGIAVFEDKAAVFEPRKELPLEEKWRFPHGHPEPFEEGGKKWLLFGSPALNVRVPATLDAVLDPSKYEAFTCAKAVRDGKPTDPELDKDGKLAWRWRANLAPVGSDTEHARTKDGKIKPKDALLSGRRVLARRPRAAPQRHGPVERLPQAVGSRRGTAWREVVIPGRSGTPSRNIRPGHLTRA